MLELHHCNVSAAVLGFMSKLGVMANGRLQPGYITRQGVRKMSNTVKIPYFWNFLHVVLFVVVQYNII